MMKKGDYSTCKFCGDGFIVKASSKGVFCSKDCYYSFYTRKAENDLKCSGCMAKVGIGASIASRLINQPSNKIMQYRNSRGIELYKTKKKPLSKHRHDRDEVKTYWWGDDKAASLWMSEYKTKDFNWGYLWEKEKANKKQLAKYHSMSDEEKKNRNARISNRDKEKRKESLRRWKLNNLERVRQLARESQKKMRRDPIKRIAINMRSRFKEIMNSVRVKPTQGKWKLIGCSATQLRLHLESMFTNKMTWDNYGSYWHVDHILPCASFDHSDPRQVAQCWHWTNLRPLEAKRNIIKGATIEEPQLNLLLCATY